MSGQESTVPTEPITQAEPADAPVVPTATTEEPTKKSSIPDLEDDGSPEGQSELTKKFTEAEWKALREFRLTVPSIFAEAFPDDVEAPTKPYTLWNVKINPTPSGVKDAKVSVVLLKFLRARNLNVASARDALVATLRWRASFGIEKALEETYPEDVFGNVGHIYGKDNKGGPVNYNLYGGDSTAIFSDVPRFLRWRVALMEKSIQELDFVTVDQLLQVHDYAGANIWKRDPNSKQAASEASSIFANHYPEFLRHKFFVNFPGIFAWIFWGFKAIVPSATFAKMEMVGGGEPTLRKTLLPFIDEDQLPKRYGGKADAF